MNGYSESVDLYKDSLKSAGITHQKFNIYLQSTEAHLEKLKNQWTTTFQDAFQDSSVRGAVDALSALSSVFGSIIKTVGILPVTLGVATAAFLNFSSTGKSLTTMFSVLPVAISRTGGTLNGLALASRYAGIPMTGLINNLRTTSTFLKVLPVSISRTGSALGGLSLAARFAGISLATVGTAIKGTLASFAAFAAPVAVIMGLGYAISYVTDKILKQKEAQKAAQKQLDDQVKSYSNNKNQIALLVSQYEALNEIQSKRKLNISENKQYVDIQNQLGKLMPSLIDHTDKQNNSVLKNVDSIRKQISATQDLMNIQEQQKRNQAPDTIADNSKKINGRYLGIDEGLQASANEMKKVADMYEKEKEDAIATGKSRKIILDLATKELAARSKQKQYEADISTLQSKNASAIKTILSDVKLNPKLKDDVSQLVSQLSFKGKDKGEIEGIVLSIGNAVKKYQDALSNGNKSDIKSTKNDLQDLINAYTNGKLTVDDFIKSVNAANNNDDNSTKKQKADTQKQLNELTKQSTSEIIKNSIAQAENTKNIKENTIANDDKASAMEKLLGYRQSDIDSIKDSIVVYELLSDQENLSIEQKQKLADATISLASQYPNLIKNGKLQVDQLLKENEANEILLQAVNKLKDGSLNAEQSKTVMQATSIKSRIQLMQQELEALDTIRKAYESQIETYYTAGKVAEAEMSQMSESYALYSESDSTKQKYEDTKKKLADLSASMDGYSRKLADVVNYNGQYYKSTQNANKSTQSSIYIADKYKKALESVNLELDKQQSIQNKYSQYSSKYQDSLKKELALLKEKKSILEAQAKDLQKQIKSGNIKQTGLITTSSPSKSSSYASGGSTKDVIWNYFKSKGLSDSAVAGIMGNLQQESGFSTSIVNPSSGATGLAQWLGGRLTNLKSFAKSRGTSYTDLQTQLDFLWKELNGSERKTLSYLLSNPGASSSTLAAGFERLFERSGGSAVGARQNYANSIYSKYAGSGSVTASSSNSSSKADKQQAIDEAKSNLIDLQSQILDINDQIQQLYLDRVNAKLAQYDHSKDMLQDDYANIDYKMEQVNENSKEWAELQKQKIGLIDKEKSYDEQAIKYLKDQIANNKELTAAQRDTLKDDLVKRTTDLLNLEKDIMDVRLQMADKVMDTYKQVLEQQKQAALDTIDDMINEIDKKAQEDQYKKDLTNKQKSALDIQSQIDELALDDSDAAKKKRLELQQQLQQQQQEIQDTMNQHNTDLRKQNLEAQKDEITKHYDDILNDETAMAKMRSDIVKGNTKDIANQLTDFYSFIKTNTKNLGTAITKNLLTLLDQASVIIPGVKKPAKLPKHHDGGIVGSTPSTNNRLTEIANKLFNVKPGEQVVKSLVGELQVPPKNIPNLFTNVNNLVNFLTQRQTPILAGNTYHLTLQVENLNGTKKDAEFILSKVVNGVKSMGGKI